MADNAFFFGRLLEDSPEAASVRAFHEEVARDFETARIYLPGGVPPPPGALFPGPTPMSGPDAFQENLSRDIQRELKACQTDIIRLKIAFVRESGTALKGQLMLTLRAEASSEILAHAVERARDLDKPAVKILGAGQSHSSEIIHPLGTQRSPWGGMKAGDQVFAMAGVRPDDVDVAQIYDAFTPRVVHDLVAYGLCPAEEVDTFVKDGNLTFGGRLPSNTAGGLISEGHLSGFGHIREGVRQMRGECGERQVRDAEICLVTGYGGAPHEAPPTVSYSALLLGR